MTNLAYCSDRVLTTILNLQFQMLTKKPPPETVATPVMLSVAIMLILQILI
jgi:hypothetical protein